MKKFACLILAVFVMVTVLAGCGGTSQNGTTAAGATTNTVYGFDVTDARIGNRSRCKITDSKGKTVYSEPVCIIEPLRIAAHPLDVYCNAGDTVTFEVEVSGGTKPYIYQWQYAYDDGTGAWSNFTEEGWAQGYFTDTLTLYVTGQDFTYNYRYRCVITDALGDVVTSLEAYPLEAMG